MEICHLQNTCKSMEKKNLENIYASFKNWNRFLLQINKKQEKFQKHICPPLEQNSKLLLICTRHYEIITLYKEELNIIK